MKLGNILNMGRVNALRQEPNAYNTTFNLDKNHKVKAQEIEKVLFPEPYENASPHYNKQQFYKPKPEEPYNPKPQNSNMNLGSILPMLTSGQFGNILKPLMSMLSAKGGGTGGLGDIAKVFELFKPKPKKKKEKQEEDISSKFDDFIIIED